MSAAAKVSVAAALGVAEMAARLGAARPPAGQQPVACLGANCSSWGLHGHHGVCNTSRKWAGTSEPRSDTTIDLMPQQQFDRMSSFIGCLKMLFWKNKLKVWSMRMTDAVFLSGMLLMGVPHVWLVYVLSCCMNFIPMSSFPLSSLEVAGNNFGLLLIRC